MKEIQGVQGSMEIVQPIEVNVDTVYVRSNIVAVDTETFKGWQYNEVQYDIKEYIKHISEQTNLAQNAINDLILGGM